MPLPFLAVSVLTPLNTQHIITSSLKCNRDSISDDVQLILPKRPELRRELRAEKLVNDDTGIPFRETTPGQCLKNADQYTYNQTELHKPNIVDGVSVACASLFCMVGNAYVASLFADLLTDHFAFCDNLTLRKR